MNYRSTIIQLSKDYFKDRSSAPEFIPGETFVPVSGKCLDAEDCATLIDASLDMWLTAGRYAAQFEGSLAKKLEHRFAKLTVSGSAANLLAFATLTSRKIGEQRVRPGDEIITVAAGFPTTVAPIIQHGCIPVFVDVELETANVDVRALRDAVTAKTRGVVLAHSLGNPFDVRVVREFCDEFNLFLIEDCCDALGSTVLMDDGSQRLVGTFGDLATLSFYPAHHITMGEGGAVLTDNARLARICESLRDWGRDCYCSPGKDNTCGKRFDRQFGELPPGYDHKYTYSHVGYNLKVSDMQAALGVSQLKKVDFFIERRRQNFDYLNSLMYEYGLHEHFLLPQKLKGSNPSWFGYLLTVKDPAKLSRVDILRSLDEKKVGARLLFGGNLTKQPGFMAEKFRISGSLENTDYIMNNSFWVGVWPGLGKRELDYIVQALAISVRKQLLG